MYASRYRECLSVVIFCIVAFSDECVVRHRGGREDTPSTDIRRRRVGRSQVRVTLLPLLRAASLSTAVFL